VVLLVPDWNLIVQRSRFNVCSDAVRSGRAGSVHAAR
jgi:hypothetical protein